MVVNKKEKCAQIINIAVLYDTNIVSTTADKITKYRDLEISLKKNMGIKKMMN